jgi:hypothetical protein
MVAACFFLFVEAFFKKKFKHSHTPWSCRRPQLQLVTAEHCFLFSPAAAQVCFFSFSFSFFVVLLSLLSRFCRRFASLAKRFAFFCL